MNLAKTASRHVLYCVVFCFFIRVEILTVQSCQAVSHFDGRLCCCAQCFPTFFCLFSPSFPFSFPSCTSKQIFSPETFSPLRFLYLFSPNFMIFPPRHAPVKKKCSSLISNNFFPFQTDLQTFYTGAALLGLLDIFVGYMHIFCMK